MGIRRACDSEYHLVLVNNLLLCCFLPLNAGDSQPQQPPQLYAQVRPVRQVRFPACCSCLRAFVARAMAPPRLYADRRFKSRFASGLLLTAYGLLARIAASTAALRRIDRFGRFAQPPACCSCLQALARAIAASTAPALRGSTASATASGLLLLFAGFWRGRWPPPPLTLRRIDRFGRFASGLLLLFAGFGARAIAASTAALRGSPPDIALSATG